VLALGTHIAATRDVLTPLDTEARLAAYLARPPDRAA
jgi:hypothetical protein